MLTWIVIIGGAVIIAWIVFSILVNIVKTTVKTAFFVAAVVLGLQFLGLGPGQLANFVGPLLRAIFQPLLKMFFGG